MSYRLKHGFDPRIKFLKKNQPGTAIGTMILKTGTIGCWSITRPKKISVDTITKKENNAS